MLKTTNIATFFQRTSAETYPLIDVRAPKEFAKGHIPGAYNLPLFEDDERAVVGMLYKQRGREAAFLKGLEIVGPKMAYFVKEANRVASHKKLSVHCWRGGMRSLSLARLWEAAGLEVEILEGGYRAYRRQLHEDLATPLKLVVLSGKTGSGKTDLLKQLGEMGEQVIDLEGLAHHKGSVFGALGQAPQPTSEQFENNLHEIINKLDSRKRIWIEDESNAIGKIFIPTPFWEQMKQAVTIVIEVGLAKRIQRLVDEYACFSYEDLASSFEKLKRRLGGDVYQRAVDAFVNGRYEEAVKLSLKYYDKAYERSLSRRAATQLYPIDLTNKDVQTLVKQADVLFRDQVKL